MNDWQPGTPEDNQPPAGPEDAAPLLEGAGADFGTPDAPGLPADTGTAAAPDPPLVAPAAPADALPPLLPPADSTTALRLPWDRLGPPPTLEQALDGHDAAAPEPEPAAPQAPGQHLPNPAKALIAVLGLLCLALLALAALTFKLWSDRTEAQQTLLAAVGAMSLTVSPDLSSTVGQRLAGVREAVRVVESYYEG